MPVFCVGSFRLCLLNSGEVLDGGLIYTNYCESGLCALLIVMAAGSVAGAGANLFTHVIN